MNSLELLPPRNFAVFERQHLLEYTPKELNISVLPFAVNDGFSDSMNKVEASVHQLIISMFASVFAAVCASRSWRFTPANNEYRNTLTEMTN